MQKNLLAEKKCFAFLNAYYPKTYQIKVLNSLDSCRPYRNLLENLQIGGFK